MEHDGARRRIPAMNTDSEGVWRKIEKSHLAMIYVVELHGLAASVCRLAGKVFEAAPAPKSPEESYIKVDHELHATIYRLLNEAGRIRALLAAPAAKPRNNQSIVAFEIRQRRARWLAGLLGGLDLAVLLHPDARHSLEHFDERLDDAGISGVLGEIPVPTVFLVDLTLGRGGSFDQFAAKIGNGAYQHALRVYLAEERVFVNAGERVDLGALHREAAAIRDRLAELLPAGATSGEERGSTIPVVVGW